MKWWENRGQCNRFPGICFTTEENPGKPQLGNRRGHLVAWPVIAPNGVPSLQMKSVAGRAKLPAPLTKPIGPNQKSMFKNVRSEDPVNAPPDHTSKIQLLRAYPPRSQAPYIGGLWIARMSVDHTYRTNIGADEMNVDKRWIEIFCRGKRKKLGENLPRMHFFRHETHITRCEFVISNGGRRATNCLGHRTCNKKVMPLILFSIWIFKEN